MPEITDTGDAVATVARLLPPLPARLRVLRPDGGAFVVTAHAWTAPELLVYAPVEEVEEGGHLVARLEHPDGPWDVDLEATAVFFHSGAERLARLRVIAVHRRRTTRGAPRVEVTHQALARVVFSAEVPKDVEFDVRLADLSLTGVGIVTEKPLAEGDLLSFMAELGGRMVRFQARCVRIAPQPYGRRRVGCEMGALSPAARAAIEAIAGGAEDTAGEAARGSGPFTAPAAAGGLAARLAPRA